MVAVVLFSTCVCWQEYDLHSHTHTPLLQLRIAQDLDSDESPTKVDEGSETESMVGELPAITRYVYVCVC